MLKGLVRDTGHEALEGITVRALSGPAAGTSVLTDRQGRFELPGSTQQLTTLEASGDGYLLATWTGTSGAFLQLAPLSPVARIPQGSYELTLVADRAASPDPSNGVPCDLPAEVSPRRHEVTVGPVDGRHPDLLVKIQIPRIGEVWAAAGRHHVSFTEGVGWIESLGEFRYIVVYVGGNDARTAPTRLADGRLVLPFSGSVEYCALKGPIRQRSELEPPNCFVQAPADRVEYGRCTSDRHQLVLKGPL